MSGQLSLLIVIADMGSGGAQQVASNLANYWVDKGRRIGVVTWAEEESDFFHLDPSVERFCAGQRTFCAEFWSGLGEQYSAHLGTQKTYPRLWCPIGLELYRAHKCARRYRLGRARAAAGNQ